MRVLFLVHLWPPHHNAGAETTAAAFAKALVDRGHQVVVQLSQPHSNLRSPYTYEDTTIYPHRDQADPIRWLTHQEKPQLIVTYLENQLRASILGGMHNVPVAVLMHNNLLKSKADLRWGAKLVVYNSEWMRADVEAWWRTTQGSDPPPGLVIRPPIRQELYRVTPPSAKNGYVTLINLYAEKGPDVFYALAQKYPQQKFLGVKGAYGAQIIRRDLPNVEFMEHVPAHQMAAKVYSHTRILLMPSSYESYGRCGVEAACSGIPTIAHPTPGLRESLNRGGNFCDLSDIPAWVATLGQLLTLKGWADASARAYAVAAELDATADLQRWVDAVESLTRVGALV